MVARKFFPLLFAALFIVFTPAKTARAGGCEQDQPGKNCYRIYLSFYSFNFNPSSTPAPTPEYSVKFVGNWKETDQQAAMQGVNAVGLALSRHSAHGPQETFNCLFGETTFYNYGVQGSYSAMASDENLFFVPGRVTPRLVVHEIGHLFDNHTLGGTTPPKMLRETGVYALGGVKVTGTKYGNYYIRNMGVKAPDNGYWSDEVGDEYQEHPISMDEGNNEFEDFADIWLNWVYGSFVPNQAGGALYSWTDKNMDTWLGRCGF